jgi:hypothetical protein
MKILFSFVGDQDPVSYKTGEEGSIVTLCRHIRPDSVYLYPTAAGEKVLSETQTRADETRHWIATEISPAPQVNIVPLHLSDPTDFALILPAIHQALKKNPVLKTDGCEVHLNCSSGTPQMKSVWLVVANSGLLPGCRLWQVMNPLYADQRVKELQIEFLEEENIMDRLDAFSRQYLFGQMAEEMGRLRSISLFAARREKARLLQKIFWVYHNWDMIKYKEAYAGDGGRQGLREIAADLKPVKEDSGGRLLKKTLASQATMLEKLQLSGWKETPENLSDLYYNACRCYARGNYTDTLARFWRVYEGTLYMRLRNAYGIEPSRPEKSSSNVNLQRVYSAKPDTSPHIALGVRRSEALLQDIFLDKMLCGLAVRKLQTNEGGSDTVGFLLKVLREKRNRSISAHGMMPVDRQDAANAIKAMQELFAVFFPSYDLSQYPLQHQSLKAAVEYLTKNFSA